MRYINSIFAFLLLCCPAFAQLGANLVHPSSATDTAAQSGSWQDAATWADGTIPVAGEKVYLPPGLTVTNHGATADVLWIHVAGTLTCCDHCDTQLNVHTLYVPMGGKLDLGSAGMPRTGKTVVEFTGGEPLAGDWQKASGGLLCMGEFAACGNEKTAWDTVDGDLAVGATSLTLLNVPFGWQVGDQILIAGTDMIEPTHALYDRITNKYQTEQRTITAISGRTITFDQPLKYRHYHWRADLPYHCANLTRNVVFRSRHADLPNRGHLMFMSPQTDLRYIAVESCGRTDKSATVTDPRKDANGVLVPGSDANPRARYPIHWHRVGSMGPPASALGVVVYGSPGWAFVNHASNVQCEDCICANYFGSGFTTEEGQERGWFRRCLATGGRGQGDTIMSTDSDHGDRLTGNWGTDGSGFWLQGGLVEVSDCVTFDNSGRGYALFNLCLNSYPDYGVGTNTIPTYLQFPITVDQSLLPTSYTQTEYWLYAHPTNIPSSFVPQRVFQRNTAYNCKSGLQSWYGNQNGQAIASRFAVPAEIHGQLNDVTLWGRGAAANFEYTRQFRIDGLKIIGEGIVRPDSNAATALALLLRFMDVRITRYEVVGKQPGFVDVGNDWERPTHSVEKVP